MNMNLKDFHRLADFFNKSNSQEKPEDDFTATPGGDKLKFFWENCKPEEIDPSSIIAKTQQKIRNDKMRRRKKLFLVASASVAASVLLCISALYLLNQGETAINFTEIAETLDNQPVDEVTLITSKEQYKLEEDALIKYSEDGKVAVNSKEIAEEAGKEVSKTNDEQEYNILFVPAGKRARIDLSDGTRVTVNSLSKVIYPRRFSGNTRKIYAQGEVFVDVTHDKKRPFIVQTDDFDLKVLGTKFAISNYKTIETANVVLVEGSVEVIDKHNNKATLSPNDLLTVTTGSIISQKQVDVSSYISWVEGILILKGNDLSTIVKKLNIYYGVPIQYTPDIGQKKVYGKLDLKDDLDKVLESIQQTVPMDIERTDTIINLK